MKKLAGLIIILAVLILGGYYGMGVLTERTIKKNIDVINQTNGLFANIEEYHRGWFSSDAQVKWRVQVPERIVKDDAGNSTTVPAEEYTVNMPMVIHHGPVIFANKKVRFGMGYAETEFPFPAQYNQKFDELFAKESTKPQIDLNIFVNYLNNSQLELALPHFKLIGKDGKGTFDWLGMESTTNISSDMDVIEGGFVVNGMTLNKEDTTVHLSKVSSEFDMHQTPAGLYLGEAGFHLPSFDVTVKEQKMFSLTDLAVSSSSNIEEGLFSTHFNLDLKSITANAKQYGPGVLEMTLRNLDAEVLASINQQANAMQNGTEEERQQAMLKMLPELPKLFSKGAELEISQCNFQLPEGRVEGNLLISLPKGDNANPFELMQKTQGNAKLKMPITVVKQLVQQSVMQQMTKQPEMQDALVQQLQGSVPTAQPALTSEQLAAMQADKQVATLQQNGVIVVDGSDYVIEVTLDQGKFTINGKPFDPAMLKF